MNNKLRIKFGICSSYIPDAAVMKYINMFYKYDPANMSLCVPLTDNNLCSPGVLTRHGDEYEFMNAEHWYDDNILTLEYDDGDGTVIEINVDDIVEFWSEDIEIEVPLISCKILRIDHYDVPDILELGFLNKYFPNLEELCII